MTKHKATSPALLDALRSAGIEIENTHRVTITIEAGQVPKVVVEQLVTDRTLDVIRNLGDVEIERK